MSITIAESGLVELDHRPLESKRIIQLESLRGFAAVYVVGHHLGNYFPIVNSPCFTPMRFGQEAVILFFLLSGFVIYTSLHNRTSRSFRNYFVKRFRRIFPIFLTALLLSYLATSYQKGYFVDPQWSWLLGNLLMLQDYAGVKPGAMFGTYFGNTPLWSLSYEWWYYMIFYPIHRYVPSKHQLPLVQTLSLAGIVGYAIQPNGPSLYLTSFVIWWAGVEMAKEYAATGSITVKGQITSIAGIGILAMIWAIVFYVLLGSNNTSPGAPPMLELRQYSAAIFMIVFGIIWKNHYNFRFFNSTLKPFSKISNSSYAIYALHWPILISSGLFSQTLREPWRLSIILVIIYLLAYLVEVRLQNWINLRTAVLLR